MAGADDVRARLAELLGRPVARVGKVRKTDENPPRISVIDVISAITGQTGANAGHYYGRLQDAHPDVCSICTNVKFTDTKGRKGQKNTPVTDVRGIVPTLDSAT